MIGRLLNSILISYLFYFACSTVSQANERLLLPFACEATPRGIVAYPSRDQSYSIVGGRDSAPFTACAFDDPNRCRTMMLHRFDIDCNGTRISWPDFYAAISNVTSGDRTRFEDGRLLIRVRPQRRHQRRRPRFAPPPSRQSFIVEMPDGYAPMRGTVARFDGQRTALRRQMRATRDPFSTPRYDEADRRFAPQLRNPTPPTEAYQPRRNAPATAKKPELRKKPSVPAKPPASAKPAQQAAVTTAAKTSPPATQKKPAEKSDRNEEESPTRTKDKKAIKSINVAEAVKKIESKNAVKPTQSVVPTLLNGNKETQKSIEDLLQARAAQVKTELDQKKSSSVLASQNKKPSRSKSTNNVAKPEPAAPSLTNTLAVLGVVAGLLLAISFAAYRLRAPKQSGLRLPTKHASGSSRITSRNDTPRRVIDLSPVPDATSSELTNDTPQTKDSQRVVLESADAHAPGPLLSAKSHGPSSNAPCDPPLLPDQYGASETSDDEPLKTKPEPQLPMPEVMSAELKHPDFEQCALIIPTTRQEALTALGVGENAKPDVIEKVVAGLRQCWQPDDAQDKHDRARRLQRMQQIETAWQILSAPAKDNAPANDVSERVQ